VNNKEMFRHYGPHYPSAFIRTEGDSFYSYYPPKNILIRGTHGSYEFMGKMYRSKDVYFEVLRVCGKPVRNVVFFDGKLSMRPLFVAPEYFITVVGEEPVLIRDGVEYSDLNDICRIIRNFEP